MRVPIYKRLIEARDNPNADLHKLTTDILALFSVVGQSEQLICDHCGKYKRLQGNGIIHQLCECGE